MLDSVEDAKLLGMYDTLFADKYSESDYKENLKKLGFVDMDVPSNVNIYAATFEDKEAIADIISDYNDEVEEDDKIAYTDIMAQVMSSFTTIINAITYVLIAFVSISLIVSSIMIGIITYISVLERTKEIGILRSIGASKKDISRVFNAETMIVGFVSGTLGIVVTLLLLIPINIIIEVLSDIANVAVLPPVGAVLLVAISVGLTLIAGLIPSRVAAKKDPVEALRTE
jgi:putative ABC transport system permease protein